MLIDTLARTVPYSREAYFSLFGQYNDAIWPAQIAACLFFLLIPWAAAFPMHVTGRVIAAILGAAWLWNGIAFHLMFFSRLNWAAWIFACLFIVQALLFFVTGTLRDRIAFRLRRDAAAWAGLFFIAYAIVMYPLVAEPVWPQLPLAGVAPCPTALATFGALLLIEGRTPWRLIAIPALWSLFEGTNALVLGIPQDYVLPAAALISVLLVARKNRLSASAA